MVVILLVLCMNGLSGYGAEVVIVAIIALTKDFGTSGDLVNVFLFVAVA